LFLVANRLKQNYKEAKAYLDQLDRSILAKAFRGELVPQDPNDEPASVLLERIRAEREKLDTKKKAKGKTEKKSHKAKPEVAEPKQLSLPGFE
jgi:type I restriction enzyme S subunit